MNRKKRIIVVLFAITFLFIQSSFAIYKRGVAGVSSAVLAEWSVSLDQNGIDNSVSIIPGLTNDTFTLNVKSLSQVDVKYDIVLSNLPSGVEVSINGVDFTRESNGTVTIPNAGTILYNANTRTNSHTLTFRGITGATIVNNQSVNVNVIVEQII